MKKFSFIVMLALFAFFACQTDTVNTDVEAVENDSIELKRTAEPITSPGVFNPIPEKFAKDPEAYVTSQMNIAAEGDVIYGCVSFIGQYAFIDDGCVITSGVPEEFEDCDLKGVRILACAPNYYNPDCIICAVAYIIECDGRLGWVLGYNIICNAGPQPF